jgi:hypothetical protein
MAAYFEPLGEKSLRRSVAALLCLALLYFAAGGSLLHLHSGGQDKVCHVCQSLQAPVLAAAAGVPLAAPELAGWHHAGATRVFARCDFSFPHAGRAPPAS